jgi:5-methylcytosine-specific restriction protein A
MKNPDWKTEEIILALNLFFHKTRGPISPLNPKIIELSEVLNKLFNIDGIYLNYRTPNSISLKLSNFLAIDPNYKGKGMKSYSKLDHQLFNKYFKDLELLEKDIKQLFDNEDLKTKTKSSVDWNSKRNSPSITFKSNDHNDFRERINELIKLGFNNFEITVIIRNEYRIYLSDEQIEKRKKILFPKLISYSDQEHMILHILENSNEPILARTISRLIFEQFNEKKIHRKEIRNALWNNLKSKVIYNPNTFCYSLNGQQKEIDITSLFKVFEIESKINLKDISKSFIKRDATFLNTGVKSIDKLINSYLHSGHKSKADLHFIKRKLEENNLQEISLIEKSTIRLANFHLIEDLVHLIFEDHVIMKYELEYLKLKIDESDIPEEIANKRFWQISVFYYFDDLSKIPYFLDFMKLIYIAYKVSFQEYKNSILSLVYIDIFKHETIENTIEYGVKELTRQLNHTLVIKNIKWNNIIITIETLLQNIFIINQEHNYTTENINQRNPAPLIPKILAQPISSKEKNVIKTQIQTELTNSIDLLDQLEDIDKTKLIEMISKGNRLSAFFFYSNLAIKNSNKNVVQENFELIWENFSI